MNQIFDRIISKINPSDIRLILPENDSRINEAKKELLKIGFQIVDSHDYQDSMDLFYNKSRKMKFSKNWPEDKILSYISNPVNFGMLMLNEGYADGLIAGAVNSTADIIRSGLRFIGIKNESVCLSSMFLMIKENKDRVLSYADCAVIPEPSEIQLADIAYNTAINHKLLNQEAPKVAFLSFSTNSSANHYRVEKVRGSIKIFKKKYNNILCEDVEVQFDSAICPDIINRKYSKSVLNGAANVLIYPNLDAGNIAYKITQRIGGYDAIGPLLQGFKQPVHDLSRGCSTQDIVNVSLIAAYQGAYNNANI